MNWYLVKLIFTTTSGAGRHAMQTEEQARLVQAAGKRSAYHKARKLGFAEEETFLNQHHEEVNVTFKGISDIHEIDTPSDGLKLCSKTYEEGEDKHFLLEVMPRINYFSEIYQAEKSVCS